MGKAELLLSLVSVLGCNPDSIKYKKAREIDWNLVRASLTLTQTPAYSLFFADQEDRSTEIVQIGRSQGHRLEQHSQ